jgi:hypothetical protein
LSGLPEPALAVRRLARLVVERHDLHPPVDVRELCAEYAEAREVSWPHADVDGLLFRRGDRARILIRITPRARRQRFTFGHELGHVLIPWHVGDLTCKPSYEVADLSLIGPEQEADIFASGILMPDRWMAKLLVEHRDDMNAILSALNQAEVSAMAALLGLRRNLFSGWVFILHPGQGDAQFVITPGTQIPVTGPDRRRYLVETALDRGRTLIQDRSVEWFRMRPAADMPADFDADSRATPFLRSALSEFISSPTRQRHLEYVLNGKVGGILRAGAGRPATELFATLEYRLQDEFPSLISLPDFRTWLAIKAMAIERGATQRRLRRT